MSLIRKPEAPAPYLQIRQILQDEIRQDMSAGNRIAPERELAKRFGVSRTTIGRAISTLVNDGLLVRRVGDGTFVVGNGAPAQVKTHSVGLVMPYIKGHFPAVMIQAAVRGLRSRGYKTVLFDSENEVVSEASELERLIRSDLDGALVMPVELQGNSPVFAKIIRSGFPIVFMDRRPLEIDVDYVGSDHFWGAREVTGMLIERGHKRIAHFTSLYTNQSSSIVERRLGYEQALKDHGIEIDPELICPPAVFSGNRYEYKHVLSYLHRGKRPVTGIFALNDFFAAAVVTAFNDLGLKIGKDLEIAAFFDQDLPFGYEVPILKAVQRQDEVGRLAVDLLVSRIEGTGPEGPQTITVRPDIVDYK